MIIRTATKSDLKIIAELEKEIFNEDNFPLSIRNLRYHFRKGNMILIASLNEEIAGYALVFIRNSHGRIYSIATNPKFRGVGAGKKLMDKILSETEHLHYLTLEVRKDNTSAISLYKKYGFNTVREILEYYDDGCTALKMKRFSHNLCSENKENCS